MWTHSFRATTTKELATRWFTGIWNERNPGVIHELMDPGFLGHTEGGTLVGPDSFVTLRFRDGKLVEGVDGWNAQALAGLLTTGAEAASVRFCG